MLEVDSLLCLLAWCVSSVTCMEHHSPHPRGAAIHMPVMGLQGFVGCFTHFHEGCAGITFFNSHPLTLNTRRNIKVGIQESVISDI